MLPNRRHAFHALLVVGALATPAPVSAATMYSVYQGGVGGTLEYQFSTDVPLSPTTAPSGTGFGDAPLDGSVQYFGPPSHFLNAWSVQTIPNVRAVGGMVSGVGDTLFFKTISSLTLQFASGTIPTTPGTYALVGGFVSPGNGIPIPAGSYGLRGSTSLLYPLDQELQDGIVTFVDTVVISDPGLVQAPEPASAVLATVALLLVATRQALRCRRLVRG